MLNKKAKIKGIEKENNYPMAHRGEYGIRGGGGMYKSTIAGFSFLVDPLAELQGD